MTDEIEDPYSREELTKIFQALHVITQTRKGQEISAPEPEALARELTNHVEAEAHIYGHWGLILSRKETKRLFEALRDAAAALTESLERLPWECLVWLTADHTDSIKDLLLIEDLLLRTENDARHIGEIAARTLEAAPTSKGRTRDDALINFIQRLAKIYERASGLPAKVKHRRGDKDEYFGPFFELVLTARPSFAPPKSDGAWGKFIERALNL